MAKDYAYILLLYFYLYLLSDPTDALVKLEFETLSLPTDPVDVDTGRFCLLTFLSLSTRACLVVWLICSRLGV